MSPQTNKTTVQLQGVFTGDCPETPVAVMLDEHLEITHLELGDENISAVEFKLSIKEYFTYHLILNNMPTLSDPVKKELVEGLKSISERIMFNHQSQKFEVNQNATGEIYNHFIPILVGIKGILYRKCTKNGGLKSRTSITWAEMALFGWACANFWLRPCGTVTLTSKNLFDPVLSNYYT